MKKTFSRLGIPEAVFSDGGPQFQKVLLFEFATFGKEFGFKHTTSSPRYAQSNGMAEAAVKIAKNCLKKTDDIYKSVLSYHSTKLKCGFSPAELLFGRKLRNTVPIIGDSLVPQVIPRDEISRKDEMLKEAQKRDFDKRHNARELSVLQKGDNVWITDKREYGRLLDKADTPRSYVIQTSNGQIRRNRFHLIPAYQNDEELITFEPNPIPTRCQNNDETTLCPNNDQNNESHLTNQTNLPDIPCDITLPPNVEAADPLPTTTRYGRVIKPRTIMDL